jgi:CRISPR-associated protein Cmr3
MSVRTLLIEPRDPVIFRDGKPFGRGAVSARSLPFPMPATIAGAVRTRCATEFDDDTIERILRIQQTGPFLAAARWEDGAKWELLFPAPADCVPYDAKPPEEHPNGKDAQWFELCPLRPATQFGGADLPLDIHALLRRRLNKQDREGKVAPNAPTFWHWSFLRQWLENSGGTPRIHPDTAIGWGELERQQRVHVAIGVDKQTAIDGMLFATNGLEFDRRIRRGASVERIRHAIVTRFQGADTLRLNAIDPIGGERRLAFWQELGEKEVAWPEPPRIDPSCQTIRLQLVTPGNFRAGWRPDWLTPQGGEMPGTGVKLRLISAAVPRPAPISGWDLKEKGTKATRFLAPAGSVYFCEVEGSPKNLWLQSMCEEEQDRRDGFGLVVYGAWEWHKS